MRALRLLTPITPGAARAMVILFVLSFALSGTAYLAAVGYYHREQGAQQRQAAQQAAQQAKEAQAFERKLCTTLGTLAALKPPPGSPSDLSRAYLDRQHEVLAELGPDVGCRR